MKKLTRIYITIIVGNLGVLGLGLLYREIGNCVVQYHSSIFILMYEGFIILGLTFLAIFSVNFFFRNYDGQFKVLKNKLKNDAFLIMVIVLLCTGYKHFEYLSKFVDHQIINRSTYLGVCEKKNRYINFQMLESTDTTYSKTGSRAEHLTYKEYQMIDRSAGFFNLPKEAYDISYSYWFEGFLPDYRLSVSYNVPLGFSVETFSRMKEQFTASKSIDRLENELRVKHYEELW